MLVSLSWLKKYVQISQDTRKLAEDLTMAGLNVERIIEHGVDAPDVVAGRVLAVEGHPNADRLRVCRVDVGEGEPREIVCGAPNVADGQTVLVALPGATLTGGIRIRASKIRGVRSAGMICSETELGIGDDASGIIVLADGPAPGTPISEVLGGKEDVLEIEVTPNRPDLLSHVGVAREVGAMYRVPVDVPVAAGADDTLDADFEVEIADGADCPRYVGLRVSGVKVGPSPRWLAGALESVGLHAVNNIVDVANYVMLELGQPLHAFDYKKLHGERIIVRRADDGEALLALDGRRYEMSADHLVIADDREAVALAGIIGGEESAVHEDTSEILIESANFHAQRVRIARKALAITTDSAYRFERGVDRDGCRRAAERAAQLICEVAGGQIGAIVDAYPGQQAPATVTIRQAQTRRILGSPVTIGEIEESLRLLGFKSLERSDDALEVEVPSQRLDIVEEIDLIEEVARVYGYDRIGTGWHYRCTTFAQPDEWDRFLENVSDHLVGRGFSEVVTSSFTDGREFEDLGWASDDPRRRPIEVRNPLSVYHRYLRTSVLPGLLDVVRRNFDQGARSMCLYHVGAEFIAEDGTGELPEERPVLALVCTNSESDVFWNHSKSPSELFELRKEIELLAGRVGVDLAGDVEYHFNNGRFEYRRSGEVLIEGGVLNDDATERYEFDQSVWYATIALRPWFERRHARRRARAISEFPASKRDLSLVAHGDVGYAQIEKLLVKSGGALLESVHVFDVYRGEPLGEDRTAYGVRLQFRSPERTLTDADVDQVIKRMLNKLRNELNIELRS